MGVLLLLAPVSLFQKTCPLTMKHDIPFIILTATGSLLLVFGYLIRFRRQLGLIAGVSADMHEKTDRKRFAAVTGWGIILLGLTLCLVGIVRKIYPDACQYVETAGLVLFLAIISLVFIKARKFIAIRPEADEDRNKE